MSCPHDLPAIAYMTCNLLAAFAHKVKDNSQNFGVFVQEDRRVVDVDGWVVIVLVGPESKQSYRGLNGCYG